MPKKKLTLDELVDVANELIKADEVVAKQKEQLKKDEEYARRLREETIPNAMAELGLNNFELADGRKVTVSQVVYASIPVDCREKAFEWLVKHGHSGLIKMDVVVKHTKGQDKEAKRLFKQLVGRGIDAQLIENVHPQTLKAFLKEQIANKVKVPLDLFGARPVTVAKIK